MNKRGFIISAPQSGSGKTTVSLAIMAALSRRGVNVIPFKCGPDFIDPGYHYAVTGKTSINLDGWMCKESFVSQTFHQNTTDQTVGIIEGAMGLFDGLGASSREGSSAQIAAITGTPVVLVVNARGMGGSAAALVKGFAEFDPDVRIAGIIFNNIGSNSHAELLTAVMKEHTSTSCFGCIPRDRSLEIPSRHLGLLTTDENPLSPQFIQNLADIGERFIDLEGLCKLKIDTAKVLPDDLCKYDLLGINKIKSAGVKIAVARDRAFCFCYDDNLRLLREAGAELLFFSPLYDKNLPKQISGIYLPGGYPELYAEKLSENITMRNAITKAVESGMPVFAECGGFMYLTEGMIDGEDFVGIFPVRTKMLQKRKALGYREATLLSETIIGKPGLTVRGHEFHYSEIGDMPNYIERTYKVSRRGEFLGNEGYRYKNCLGSYLHLHFGSNPQIAPAFMASSLVYGSEAMALD